ncbi:hypothetical protein RvY_13364 [Ramazzottius varieornatus]|uniref:Lariat debranching enzyme C-terminal domain-containing protein n=1 Tax=Ramazzottius varieornatus TaxID=947166 RepID=A0A1D1VMK6_RAMVA|nr:hypothetical protein RvY_13364 [Ramazzottius varieornatus]
MLIAVEGCCHGELDKIYETLAFIEKEHGKKVDLLICCGDFQSTRNVYDLSCMAVPPKYLAMMTFYKYYSGEKTAPVPTLFIGGNHEASNYLQELTYGGWVAPNIYYLGLAGVVNFGGLRIGGMSGIFKGHDYMKGHFELPPYSENTKRSIYHVRQLEVFRLKQISRPVDIFVSHDWPVGVTDHGNVQQLLRFKPYFREDIETRNLGNPNAMDVMKKLKPNYWFSGHMHAKWAANVPHEDGSHTKFLALDKCMPGKRFLQIIDIPQPATDLHTEPKLSFDPEWLGILRDTNHLWHFENSNHYMPGAVAGSEEKYDFAQTDEQIEEVRRLLGGNLDIDPSSFQRTGPVHETAFGDGFFSVIIADMKAKNYPLPPVTAYVNPQTTELCQKMGLTDPLRELMSKAPTHDPKDFTSDFMSNQVNQQNEQEEEREAVDTEAVTVYFEEGMGGVEGSTEEPASKKLKTEGEGTVEDILQVKNGHENGDSELTEVDQIMKDTEMPLAVAAEVAMDKEQYGPEAITALAEETTS